MGKKVFVNLLFVAFMSIFQLNAQKISHNSALDDSLGAVIAVKKAYQMTDLCFSPVGNFNSRVIDSKGTRVSYTSGKEYKGMVYSNTREVDGLVGVDVSLYTFMTAIHNPRSVLYTVKINRNPYHGKGDIAYYGAVCSGLVSSALGLTVKFETDHLSSLESFERISRQNADGVKVADVLWKKGHVALVTSIEKDKNGVISKIEYCEGVPSGARRMLLNNADEFNSFLKEGSWIIYRYKYLYKNTFYAPANEFVAVGSEEKLSFTYNDDICTNRGDKACIAETDSIILNISDGFDKLEIYKNDSLYKTMSIGNNKDVLLKGYPFGDYKACVVKGNKKSDYTYWKVINTNIRLDKANNRVYFNSANSTPIYYEFCSISGYRPNHKKRIYAREFTNDEINSGCVIFDSKTCATKTYPYLKIHFANEYGRVASKLINWFED